MRKHSLETAVLLAILLILMFAVYGCGTRSVELEKKTDIKIENNYQEGEKIVLGNTFTYRPFDNLKPMVVDGKKYENAIVSNDKSIVKEKWQNRNITKTIVVEKTKHTKKNTLWIGIAFVAGLFIFLWFYLKK